MKLRTFKRKFQNEILPSEFLKLERRIGVFVSVSKEDVAEILRPIQLNIAKVFFLSTNFTLMNLFQQRGWNYNS